MITGRVASIPLLLVAPDVSVVWVTGAAGFIGTHLTRYLAAEGVSYGGVGNPPDSAVTESALPGNWVAGAVSTDTLDRLATLTGAPACVFHLAGGASVGASLADPELDFDRTVGGSERLLEWLRHNAPTAELVVASSAATYGGGHESAIGLDAPKRPCSPYGEHKLMVERMCRAAAGDHGLKVAIIRFFSVYGAGLRKQLLWDISCKLTTTGGADLGGTGDELRDWIEISDAVRLLVLARERAAVSAPIFNGATGVGTSVRDIATGLAAALGHQQQAITFSGTRRAGDPVDLVARADSLMPGFRPQVPVVAGLDRYANWFKASR